MVAVQAECLPKEKESGEAKNAGRDVSLSFMVTFLPSIITPGADSPTSTTNFSINISQQINLYMYRIYT
jgi:hypothetical protein